MFKIGHCAYSGANKFEIAASYKAALCSLIKRGVSMDSAHNALQKAKNGSWVVARGNRGINEVQPYVQ